MKHFFPLSLAIFLPLWAHADITVSGQSFPLHFEDASLSADSRSAIEADVSAFWAARTNAVVEMGVDGIVRGRIFDDAIYATPYATPGLEVPAWIITTGPELALRIPREFSSAFLAAQTLCSSHTNEVAALSDYLDRLTPEHLATATAEELQSLVFHSEATSVPGEEETAQLRHDLSALRFHAPSILGVAEVPSGATESADIRFVALLPVSASGSGPYDYGVCRVGWDGRKWVLLSLL